MSHKEDSPRLTKTNWEAANWWHRFHFDTLIMISWFWEFSQFNSIQITPFFPLFCAIPCVETWLKLFHATDPECKPSSRQDKDIEACLLWREGIQLLESNLCVTHAYFRAAIVNMHISKPKTDTDLWLLVKSVYSFINKTRFSTDTISERCKNQPAVWMPLKGEIDVTPSAPLSRYDIPLFYAAY